MDVKPKSRWRISKWLVPCLILIGFLSFHAYHRYLFEKRTALVKRLKDTGATVRYTWFGVSSMPDFLRPHLPFIDLPVKPRVFDIDANNIKLSEDIFRELELMTYLNSVNLENKPYLLLINLEQTAITPTAVNRLQSKINQLKENLTPSTQRDKKLVITISNKQSPPEQLPASSVKSD